MIDIMEIDGHKIVPGQNAIVHFDIAKLPSGTEIHLPLHVFRSAVPGPTLAVTGGVHGDEVNGVEIVRRAITSGLFKSLLKGNVLAIPLVNIYGFINFSRDLADGKDVNRSFPGNENGSLASRVAHTLSTQIIPLMDYGVDYHTGGASRYNYPQVRFSIGDEEAEKLAKVFASPYLIKNKAINKSFRKTAKEAGKPILVYEGGESLRYDQHSIDEGLDGLKRLMAHLGMIDEVNIPKHDYTLFTDTTWIRSPRSGLFLWYRKSGEEVKEGEVLGHINDPQGLEQVPVLASRDGYIVGHNNAPVVSLGDALFHLGFPE